MSADPTTEELDESVDWEELDRINAHNAIIKKLADGGILTEKEKAFMREQESRRGKPPAETPKSAGPKLAEIASFYGTSEMTIRRCEDLARLPDVPSPPPWADPSSLAAWYRAHYRSDPAKPPSRRDKLPRWLEESQGKKPSFATPAVQTAATPPPPANEPARLLSYDEMILAARSVVAEAKAAMDRAPGDSARGSAYMEALKQLQMLEDRARKTGLDDMVPKNRVCGLIDSLLARVPRSLELDMTHAFPEFARIFRDHHDVEAQQRAWAEVCAHFVKLSLSRITESKFADRIAEAA